MEETSNSRGKIFAIIFVALLILPVCYGLFRALVIDKHKTNSAQPANAVEQK